MNETLDQQSRLSTTLDALCATLQQFEASFQAHNADLGTRIDRIVAAVSENASAAQNTATQQLAASQERISALESKISDLEKRNSELQHKIDAAAPPFSPAGAPSYAHGGAETAATVNARRVGAETALRKTLPPSMCAVLSKTSTTDLDAAGHFEVAALDKALSSLSVDQRIAVKAEMARAGLIA